jgi:hypothetical protein
MQNHFTRSYRYKFCPQSRREDQYETNAGKDAAYRPAFLTYLVTYDMHVRMAVR